MNFSANTNLLNMIGVRSNRDVRKNIGRCRNLKKGRKERQITTDKDGRKR